MCFVLSGGCLEFYSCLVWVYWGCVGGILGVGWDALGWVICINRALVCYEIVLVGLGLLCLMIGVDWCYEIVRH